jgi:hypothetical protein
MANSQPTSSDARAPADDLLDEVVEAALIETTREMEPELPAAVAPGEAEAEAFLRGAVAFLNTRADCAALIEKLCALVGTQSGEAKPERPDADGGSDGKSE